MSWKTEPLWIFDKIYTHILIVIAEYIVFKRESEFHTVMNLYGVKVRYLGYFFTNS